jgi:hypothetical protein
MQGEWVRVCGVLQVIAKCGVMSIVLPVIYPYRVEAKYEGEDPR